MRLHPKLRVRPLTEARNTRIEAGRREHELRQLAGAIYDQTLDEIEAIRRTDPDLLDGLFR